MHRERENPPEGKGINGTPREERGSRRQKEEEPQSVSRRVAGNLSSTRAELAAIAQAIKIAPIETDLDNPNRQRGSDQDTVVVLKRGLQATPEKDEGLRYSARNSTES